MKSAAMSRALLKAVSPLVIGAATTPSNANTAPTLPNQEEQIVFTKMAGEGLPVSGFIVAVNNFSYGVSPSTFRLSANLIAAAAQIRATNPSVIIAP